MATFFEQLAKRLEREAQRVIDDAKPRQAQQPTPLRPATQTPTAPLERPANYVQQGYRPSTLPGQPQVRNRVDNTQTTSRLMAEQMRTPATRQWQGTEDTTAPASTDLAVMQREAYDSNQARVARERALGLTQENVGQRRKTRRLDENDFNDLSKRTRALMDLTGAVKASAREDRKGGGLKALEKGERKTARSEYDKLYEKVFGVVPDENTEYAPATLALLDSIGFQDDTAELNDFLNLSFGLREDDISELENRIQSKPVELSRAQENMLKNDAKNALKATGFLGTEPDLGPVQATLNRLTERDVPRDTKDGTALFDPGSPEFADALRHDLQFDLAKLANKAQKRAFNDQPLTDSTRSQLLAGSTGQRRSLGLDPTPSRFGFPVGDATEDPAEQRLLALFGFLADKEGIKNAKDLADPETADVLAQELSQMKMSERTFRQYILERIERAEQMGTPLITNPADGDSSSLRSPEEMRKLLGLTRQGA